MPPEPPQVGFWRESVSTRSFGKIKSIMPNGPITTFRMRLWHPTGSLVSAKRTEPEKETRRRTG